MDKNTNKQVKRPNIDIAKILAAKPSVDEPLPFRQHKFPTENFIDYYITEQEFCKMYKLKINTYLYPRDKNQELKGVIFFCEGINSHVNRSSNIAYQYS